MKNARFIFSKILSLLSLLLLLTNIILFVFLLLLKSKLDFSGYITSKLFFLDLFKEEFDSKFFIIFKGKKYSSLEELLPFFALKESSAFSTEFSFD